MKAFIGHGFNPTDSILVDRIKKFIETLGIECVTGQSARSKSIDNKIIQRISECDIFVGIFTKEKMIINKYLFFPKSYTTSNWVIQESGFAIGKKIEKKMELIFLVEKGISKFPELQGQLEIIYFKRNNIEDVQQKLSEMLSEIKKQNSFISQSITPESTVSSEIQEEEKQKIRDEKIVKKENTDSTIDKIYKALFEDKNYEKAQEICENEIIEEKISLKAFILRYSYKVGDKSAYNKLLDLVNKNTDNPDAIFQLALLYKSMNEYIKAKDRFIEAKELYKTDSSKLDNVLDCYYNAGLCIVYDDKYINALQFLTNALDEFPSPIYKAKILGYLAKFAKQREDYEKFYTYAESSLDIDPSDSDLRFDLAYIYSLHNYNKISLLHYKILTNTIKSPDGLNNLGVQYENTGLPSKSIECYIEAGKLKSTLALANISNRYIASGFIENAEEQIFNANNMAKEGIEIHGNIGEAKNKITTTLENENKKEKQILLEAKREKEFRVKYGKAYNTTEEIQIEEFCSKWKTSWGDVTLIYDSEKQSFTTKMTIKIQDPLMTAMLKKDTPNAEYFKIRVLEIYGNLTHMCGKYHITVKERGDYSHSTLSDVYIADGLLVINPDYNTIECMEKTKNEDYSFTKWEKTNV